ncbi:DEAD-box ATP-dependent RNA helicase 52C [Vitis vinifera]|uniref:RNA helicase n=1 Tax=Vitis vinifera TaxID=29760 RepID=A0A438JQ34_VITVI|nr:DEAD-box ATP-dependent RNA helicase 52C [Vitis vinifera]
MSPLTHPTNPTRLARPTRPTYVPPHLRHGAAVATTNGATPIGSDCPPEQGRTATSRGRGQSRGRGRGQGWGQGREASEANASPFDGSEKFDELEEVEDTNGGLSINFDAYEDIPVEASGSDIPPPVSAFAEIHLGEGLNQNIRRCKYVKPTPIQRHAIPIAMAGRDLMACAQTGSGKTAAFCFPIICGILRNQLSRGGARLACPTALILSPTRELSCQVEIHEEAKKFSYKTGLKVVVAYGGAPISQQTTALECGLYIYCVCELGALVLGLVSVGGCCRILDFLSFLSNRTPMKKRNMSRQSGEILDHIGHGSHIFRNLERGVDILVATPGRLVDMIERARVSLRMIKYLALDEADRMLDMGFEPQIRKIVEQMDMPPPGARQTMLFSATFPNEIQLSGGIFMERMICRIFGLMFHIIVRLAADFLSNYIFLSVGRVGSSTDLIVQRVEFVEDTDKRYHLMDLLQSQMTNRTPKKYALTLVFVETKRGVDALEQWLCMNGLAATAIHGDKVQMERERALKSFKSGATPIMVATDVAARGLDIPHVAHVINFDLPKAIDDYVHRIGRTGRAGKSGLATAFFNDGNLSLAKSLVELMQESNQEVPSWLNQYAERPSYGGGRSRYGGGRFGGHDFRSSSQLKREDYYSPSPYGDVTQTDVFVAPASGEGYYSIPYGEAAPPDSYAAGSDRYGFDHGSIVASGWD